MWLGTRRTKRTLATRQQSDLPASTPDRHEFDLASAKLLPTTSLRLQTLIRALRRGESQPWRRMSALAFADATPEIAINVTQRRGALPLRCEEINLICNHKFV